MGDRAAADPIRVRVNGEEREVPGGISVAGLLDHLDLDRRAVVVEHNRRIIRGEALDDTEVAGGDEVEIVHFVGGG